MFDVVYVYKLLASPSASAGQEVNPSLFSGLAFIVFMLLTQAHALPQVLQHRPVSVSNRELATVRRAVTAFLNSWLVKQDLKVAIQSFGLSAFQNEYMLQESCAAYIKPELKSSELERRAGIGKFLKEFLPVPPVQRLSQVLNDQMAIEIRAQLGAHSANNPKNDGFVLAKLSRNEVPTNSEDVQTYLSSRLSANSYLSLVPIGGGTVFFLWIQEASVWRIIHASLVCL